MGFLISTQNETSALIITIEAKKVDLMILDDLKKEVTEALGGTESLVIVDLKKVIYLDSLALGYFISLHLSLRREGRTFALASIRASVKEVLAFKYVDKLLSIFDNVDEAMKISIS